MDLFNYKYKLAFNMTQRDFVEKLSNATRHRDGTHRDIFPDAKKYFIGEVEYNHFTLVRNYTSISKSNYKLLGTITENSDSEVTVVGYIKGHKFPLIFLTTYTLGCIFFLIYNLCFIPESEDNIIALSILSIIGLINSITLINGLNNFKNRFLKMIENFDKE